jgi:Peptidase family M1 domain
MKLDLFLLIRSNRRGEPYRQFSAIIGWNSLMNSVEQLGCDHEFTKLLPNLMGKDPDDAFSSVPYEKGFTFLYHLETLVGKQNFDAFIPHVGVPALATNVSKANLATVLHKVQREISRFL